jgi:hypothetical protein
LLGGAQAGLKLSRPRGGELDPSAAPVFRVDLAPDQRSCLELIEQLDQVCSVGATSATH